MLKGASELHQIVTEALKNKSCLSSLEAMLPKIPRSIINMGCNWGDYSNVSHLCMFLFIDLCL